MTKLQWDRPGEHFYETGIENGVLYIPGGRAVSWNGLVSLEDSLNDDSNPYHVDGVKYLDKEILGDFEARLKAFTYPDAFEIMQGYGVVAQGLLVGDQKPRLFSLSYRTRDGNDIDGPDHGYRIHILYNVYAVQDEFSNTTLSDSVDPIEFQWDLTCTPSFVRGYRPTAHVIIDSRYIIPEFLEALLELLYGTEDEDPELPTLDDLANLAIRLNTIIITDHGDGTWSADGPGRYFTISGTEFEITDVDAVYSDEFTYDVQTTIPRE